MKSQTIFTMYNDKGRTSIDKIGGKFYVWNGNASNQKSKDVFRTEKGARVRFNKMAGIR